MYHGFDSMYGWHGVLSTYCIVYILSFFLMPEGAFADRRYENRSIKYVTPVGTPKSHLSVHLEQQVDRRLKESQLYSIYLVAKSRSSQHMLYSDYHASNQVMFPCFASVTWIQDQGTPKEIIHFHSSNSLRLAKNAVITKRCRALIRTSAGSRDRLPEILG